jgi:CheY-like chemotaxis protein
MRIEMQSSSPDSDGPDEIVPDDERNDESYDAASRPLILLAEDDLDVQGALIEFLEMSGYDVVAVNNGSDMLDALARAAAEEDREADLIITDVRMPGFNGLSIAEELRADGWTQPIIIISAFGDDVIRERIRRMEGATEFFPKPLDPLRLERALQDLCAR